MFERYSHLIWVKERAINLIKYVSLTNSIGSRRGRGKKREGRLKGRDEVVRNKEIKREGAERREDRLR